MNYVDIIHNLFGGYIILLRSVLDRYLQITVATVSTTNG